MELLNSPIEVAVRVLALLEADGERGSDITRLVLLDHGLVHSQDLEGPASLFPAIPGRLGELSVKRGLIEQALALLMNAHLVKASPELSGVKFVAVEDASDFLDHMSTDLVQRIMERARWVTAAYGELDQAELRQRYVQTFARWAEEFDVNHEGAP